MPHRASVRQAYSVYYVQKSAAYAEITHQRRTTDIWKFLSTAKNGYWDVLSAEKTRPHLPDYVIYVPPSYWKLISFVYWPRKDFPLDISLQKDKVILLKGYDLILHNTFILFTHIML